MTRVELEINGQRFSIRAYGRTVARGKGVEYLVKFHAGDLKRAQAAVADTTGNPVHDPRYVPRSER